MSSPVASSASHAILVRSAGFAVTLAVAAGAAVKFALLGKAGSSRLEQQLMRRNPPAHSLKHESAMMRCLTQCRDVQFTLMRMLHLEDLVQLDATCRTWRAQLLNPPLLDGLRFIAHGEWSRLRPLLHTHWAPQLITSIEQGVIHMPPESHLRFCAGSVEEQQQQCAVMLRTLPRCTRLRQLTMHIREVPQNALDACFSGVAHSLHTLHVETHGPDAQLLQSLFRSLHPLRALEALEIIGQQITPALDFSGLPLMPHLSTFVLTRGRWYADSWQCSPEQVQCLVRCRSLTRLVCGRWSAVDSWSGAQLHYPDGIGALVGGWLDVPAAASSTSSAPVPASTVSASAPSVTSLTHLNMRTSGMTSVMWTHVSRLTTLSTLHPSGWQHGMTADQWSQLARFSQLQRIKLQPLARDGWLESEHIVPPLLGCKQLSALTLTCIRLSQAQLHAICTSLLRLQTVTLNLAQLEDCAPFALAPSLTELILNHCSGVTVAPMQFRTALPAMAYLTHLCIDDAQRQRITEDQAAPLNAALFARMPMLTLAKFKQNLLAVVPAVPLQA